MRSVYLAGAIHHTEYDETWREQAFRVMGDYFNMKAIDPLEYDEPDVSDHEIVNRDLYLISACDAVLVDGRTPSWGTGMEVYEAYNMRIPVVVWGKDEDGASVWLRHFSVSFQPTLMLAIEYLARLLI